MIYSIVSLTLHASTKQTYYVNKAMLKDIHFSWHLRRCDEVYNIFISSEQNICPKPYYEVLIYYMIFNHVVKYIHSDQNKLKGSNKTLIRIIYFSYNFLSWNDLYSISR
jgi:hypothetical protein